MRRTAQGRKVLEVRWTSRTGPQSVPQAWAVAEARRPHCGRLQGREENRTGAAGGLLSREQVRFTWNTDRSRDHWGLGQRLARSLVRSSFTLSRLTGANRPNLGENYLQPVAPKQPIRPDARVFRDAESLQRVGHAMQRPTQLPRDIPTCEQFLHRAGSLCRLVMGARNARKGLFL